MFTFGRDDPGDRIAELERMAWLTWVELQEYRRLLSRAGTFDWDDLNIRVICSSCAKGEHMCGRHCDCVRCFEDRMRRGAP